MILRPFQACPNFPFNMSRAKQGELSWCTVVKQHFSVEQRKVGKKKEKKKKKRADSRNRQGLHVFPSLCGLRFPLFHDHHAHSHSLLCIFFSPKSYFRVLFTILSEILCSEKLHTYIHIYMQFACKDWYEHWCNPHTKLVVV